MSTMTINGRPIDQYFGRETSKMIIYQPLNVVEQLGKLQRDAEALRDYRQRLQDFLGRAEAFCRGNEIVYHRVITDTPVEEMVLRQLKGLLLA